MVSFTFKKNAFYGNNEVEEVACLFGNFYISANERPVQVLYLQRGKTGLFINKKIYWPCALVQYSSIVDFRSGAVRHCRRNQTSYGWERRSFTVLESCFLGTRRVWTTGSRDSTRDCSSIPRTRERTLLMTHIGLKSHTTPSETRQWR